MAIQMRRGNKADFDPSKMLPGEWAVAIDNDTNNQIVWMCFRAGVVKRMGTYEDFKEQIREATAEIKNEYKEEFQTILGEIEKLAEQTSENRNTVVQIRDDTVNTYLPKVLEYVKRSEAAATKTESSRQAATTSETNAKASETAAKTSETNAKASETSAAKSATAAATSETNAKASETSASQSAATATSEAASASQSSGTAAEKAAIATQKTSEIIGKAEAAAESAAKAQSYAVGGTGSRDGEDSDNAKYYFEQVKDVSEAIKGGLQPRGTVAFADLPQLADCVVGWMFNISDEFTTTADFKEGAGNTVPAGANIYKTSDEKWDVLAGTPVTGVKGVKEKSFQRGNVVITPENIGAYTKEAIDALMKNVNIPASQELLTVGKEDNELITEESSGWQTADYLIGVSKSLEIIAEQLMTLNSSLGNLLRCDGGMQYYNIVKDLNNFYNGICLVDGATVENCPTNEFYAVMSVGLVGTRVQIAWYLWTGKMYTRHQAAGNWVSWENRSYLGSFDVIATAAGGTGAWENRTVSSLSKYKFIQIQVRDGNFSELASNIVTFAHFKDCNTFTRTFGAWANDFENVEYCGMASYADDTNLRIYCGAKINQVVLTGWY